MIWKIANGVNCEEYIMLCDTCARQRRCPPWQLAQRDRKIADMLEHLKRCALQIQVTPQPSLHPPTQ